MASASPVAAPRKAPKRAQPLRAGRHGKAPPLIPARMLNEFVYCPRLAYLEWVQKEFEDSADTVQGRHVHRTVDRGSGSVPEPDSQSPELQVARSVELSSERLNIVAKIDLLESRGGEVTPVDYKRGKRPHMPRHAYDPERVQLCAQGLLLEDHGYTTSAGILYFASSRERVRVPFDAELRALTKKAIEDLATLADGGSIPPPLQDSPKCPRCSLVGICLPDEVNWFQSSDAEIRPLSVRHTHALPLYVQAHRAKVAKAGDRLVVTRDGAEVSQVRLAETSQLVLLGNVYVTTPALHELMRRNIPVTWQSYGGWLFGHTIGTGHPNVELRTAQYRAALDDATCLRLARGWVQAKIRNCRTILRRNYRQSSNIDDALTSLKRLADRAGRTKDMPTLLGIEGAAAAAYFQQLPCMLNADGDATTFEMTHRNRRPPTDPINAMLSFGYAMLTRSFLTTLSAVGLDPYRGFYHQPRYGRPALALDMMEPFRPLLVDSVVVTALNNGEIRSNVDFVHTPVGVNLSDSGRKRFLKVFERRMAQSITHPVFGYRVEYRRLIEIQSRLLGRFLLGEIPQYPNLTTR